jgi:hypothetical protein
VRVYLAATTAALRTLADRGEAIGWDGFAATSALHHELGDLADDDLEFALSVAAGEASAAMVGSGSNRGRRFVVVADLPGADVVAIDDPPGAVRVDGAVSLSQVDALLADPHDIAVHEGVSDDLSWYATQEIGELLA